MIKDSFSIDIAVKVLSRKYNRLLACIAIPSSVLMRYFTHLWIGLNLMNNPHVLPVRKRIKFTTAILFAVGIIMVTSTFNMVILTPMTVVAQTQQLNSPSQGANSSSSGRGLLEVLSLWIRCL